MAPPLDFSGPKLKVERAEHHIGQLERLFADYIRKNRQAMGQANKYNRPGRKVTLGGKLPRHTPTVLGDAIHNLRAALDHAYCLLVEANRHKVDRYVHFPFGGDRQSVKSSIDGHIKRGHGPSERIRDIILDRIEPFPGGNGERLYGLHKLDITDKHEVLIPTDSVIYLAGREIVLQNGGRIAGPGKLIGPSDKIGLMFGGGAVRFQADGNAKTPVDVLFQQRHPFAGESIVQTMRNLLVLTNGALEVLRTA